MRGPTADDDPARAHLAVAARRAHGALTRSEMNTTNCVVMVWFRADRAHDDDIARLLAALGERMAADHRVDARAGWRDETGYRTWLETYEPVAPEDCNAFIDALRVHASALGLDALAPQGRYVEVFRWCGK